VQKAKPGEASLISTFLSITLRPRFPQISTFLQSRHSVTLPLSYIQIFMFNMRYFWVITAW